MGLAANGLDLKSIQDYVGAVKEDPGLAQVKFVATSTWQGGARTEISVENFQVNGQPAGGARSFVLHTDEPGPLGGTDRAVNPAEMLAAALCGCLTAGIATNSALFGVDLDGVDVTVELNWDMHGILGLDRSVPNQASGIHYTVKLKGKGDPEAMRRSKETLDRKSAVLNTLRHAIPITTDIVIEQT